jgi:3-oxoacyl-[acyl-carrier protein] reductase
MSDLLLELGSRPAVRRVARTLGLPIPFPERLRRESEPWRERPLAGEIAVVGAAAGAELGPVIAESLSSAGARPCAALEDGANAAALVFDATGLRDAPSLRALYDFFHPLAGRIARSGRVVVLGRPEGESSPEAEAAQAATLGFVRSLAKEIGRTGATANLVQVARGAEARLGPVLRFVLSPRSAFVSAQPIVVTARARAAEDRPVRPFEGKIALVTGAARGIGEATARLLAQEGARVVCLDRPADDAATTALARAIEGTALLVDLADAGAPGRVADALRALGGVDVVVHNAGITRDKTLARMSPEQWDAVLDVNLAAVTRTAAAIEDLVRDGGRVVCLSSVAGIAGNVGQTAYAASKAGIAGWVRGSAEHLADRGITVNAVAPGFIETRLTAAIPAAIREVGRRLSALGQGGLPEDVAQAIAFLANPGAHGITGRTLRVCGGAFIGA